MGGSVVWHSSGGPACSEHLVVASCFVGKDPALCERLALGWWSGHFGCKGGVSFMR